MRVREQTLITCIKCFIWIQKFSLLFPSFFFFFFWFFLRVTKWENWSLEALDLVWFEAREIWIKITFPIPITVNTSMIDLESWNFRLNHSIIFRNIFRTSWRFFLKFNYIFSLRSVTCKKPTLKSRRLWLNRSLKSKLCLISHLNITFPCLLFFLTPSLAASFCSRLDYCADDYRLPFKLYWFDPS